MAYSKDEYIKEMNKWKRTVLPTLRRSNVEFWELTNGTLTNANLLNR